MRKIFFFILLTAICGGVFAQGPTLEQKRVLFNKIDTLISNYIVYSTLLERGKQGITPTAINNFRQLFVSGDVSVPDEMSPAYFYKELPKPLFPSYAPLDGETAKLKAGLPVYSDEDAHSLSKLDKYNSDISSYLSNFDAGRPRFFQTYGTVDQSIKSYMMAKNSQEQIVTGKLSDFLAMAQANYPDGFTVRLLNSSISFKDIANDEVKVILSKRISGTVKPTFLKLEDVDTVVLTLKASKSYTQVLIGNIALLGYHFNFLNDKDRDFVIDAKDACPTERGFQSDGCPFPEETGYSAKMAGYLDERARDSVAVLAAQVDATAKLTALKAHVAELEAKVKAPAYWWLTVAGSGGVVSGTLTNAALGYNPMASTPTNPATAFSSGTSYGGDIMLEHYFGQSANFGLGAGLAYSSISGTLNKNSFAVAYQAQSKQGSYVQMITSLSPIQEKVSVSNLAIPIELILKGTISGNLGFKIEAGGAYNIQYNSSTSGAPTGAFDYEAIYGFGPGATTPSALFDSAYPTRGSSWLITKAEVLKNGGDPTAYFNAMHAAGYPVQLDVAAKSMTQHTSASFSSGFTVFIRPALVYNFSKGSSLGLGVYYSYSSFSQSGSSYKMVDESETNYYTLMQGASKITNSNIGIRLSYSHSLFYNVPKWIKELSGLR